MVTKISANLCYYSKVASLPGWSVEPGNEANSKVLHRVNAI